MFEDLDVRVIRYRFISPDNRRPLSQQAFSNLYGVSWTTVNRWEARRGRISPDHRRMLLWTGEILDCLGDVVAPEQRLALFMKPIPELLNMSPLDWVQIPNPKGKDQVIEKLRETLLAAETGSFG